MPVKLGTSALLARAAAAEISRAQVDPEELFIAIESRMRRAVPHDASCWTTLDPDSLLVSGALTTDMPRELLSALWDNEMLEPDAYKVADLARRRVPVAALSELDARRAAVSPRRNTILPRAGIGDELRALLRAGGVVWGCFALYRAQGSRDFSPAERRFVGEIARDVAVGLRRSLARGPVSGFEPPASGLVLVGSGDRITAATEEARRTMALMPGDPARILRGVAVAHRRERTSVRVRLTDGRWIALYAAAMTDATHGGGAGAGGGGGGGGVERAALAVSLVPPSRLELSSLMLRLHGLTEREHEVAMLLSQGGATEEVAARLSITRLTLNDHLKAIYAKVGATHRAELMALGAGAAVPAPASR